MSEFFATNRHGPPHRKINSGFGAFPSVWVRLGSFRYCTKLEAIWTELVQLVKKSLCHEVVSEFFTMNAPGPPH